MLGELAYRLDKAVGDGIERTISAHHRRRLHRLGWDRAFDPAEGLWVAGEPPPRTGNSIDVLIDGATAAPAIAQALHSARSHVHIAGWYVSPHFPLSEDESGMTLAAVLAEIAERVDVRVLLWAGAPFPPVRRQVRDVARSLEARPSITIALDDRERPLHCHHEKTIVIDDEIGFVGGIDLTTKDGDRFDSSDHHARGKLGWHDVTTRLGGPVVADVSNHFRLRWREITSEALPEPSAPGQVGNVEAQIVRTVPEKVYAALPKGDFRILEAYTRALSQAERFIYLENQYLWSPEMIEVLVAKLRNPPRDDFRVALLLPSHPNTGSDQTRGQLGVLAEADAGAGRLIASTLYARASDHEDPIYVHAKIGIVDDRWLTVGSANLNDHSLFNDTEVNVVTTDEGLARETRQRLWAEHLETSIDDVAGDPIEVVDNKWCPIAGEQLERKSSGAPLTHRLVQLPGVSKRSRRLLGPLQGLFLDG
jgi:phosphatidylserine/phosphatidylglycerophosphate/cardiolipin synthase-like enzyme